MAFYIICLCVLLFVTSIVLYREQKRLVTCKTYGGLGNRVFQVLAAMGYAERHGYKCVLVKSFITSSKEDHEQDYVRTLQALFPFLEVRDKINDYEVIKRTETAFEYKELPASSQNVVLDGYFQSEGYLPTTVPSVRKRHLPHTYFIHVRAGDYLNNRTHYVNLASYQQRCIKMIQKADPSAKFLVFSDDNEYAKHHMKQFEIPYTLSSTKTAEDTLRQMSSCAGAICANSSLSWLGAYFQKEPHGLIYMPDKWIHDGSNTADLYPIWAKKVSVT